MTTDASVGPKPTENGIANPPQTTRPVVDLSKYVIEDGEPVESWYAAKQYRLLEETLYVSWPGPGQGRTFEVATNVGLFGDQDQKQALCPDVMLAVDIHLEDVNQRRNRSWFVWERGKAPDLVIEIVSDRRGGEAGRKITEYARLGIPYYVVFDPENRLGEGVLRSFVLQGEAYENLVENRFPEIGLGLVLWHGRFDNSRGEWIRWCDLAGNLIPSGAEKAAQERERADQADQRANQAERERQIADEARERLEAKLRALGIDPNA